MISIHINFESSLVVMAVVWSGDAACQTNVS